LHVVLGRGDGTFGTPIVTNVAGRAIQVGDFNGDRRVDVVLAAATNGVSILPGNGNGTFGAARQVDSDFGAFALTGDFNGDTRRDLVLAGGPEIKVYPGNGDFTFGNLDGSPGNVRDDGRSEGAVPSPEHDVQPSRATRGWRAAGDEIGDAVAVEIRRPYFRVEAHVAPQIDRWQERSSLRSRSTCAQENRYRHQNEPPRVSFFLHGNHERSSAKPVVDQLEIGRSAGMRAATSSQIVRRVTADVLRRTP